MPAKHTEYSFFFIFHFIPQVKNVILRNSITSLSASNKFSFFEFQLMFFYSDFKVYARQRQKKLTVIISAFK